MPGRLTYHEVVAEQRRPPREGGGAAPDLREMVRLAVLAPSSHNSQPWKFRLGEGRIEVLPDFSRRCPVVDPDDGHLFKSLGCAAETIVQAATAQGFAAAVDFDSDRGLIRIAFEAAAGQVGPRLFPAIPHRQCTRRPFDGRPVDLVARRALREMRHDPGVRIVLVEDNGRREAIAEYLREGDRAQLGDPAFRKELLAWLRFNDAAALASGDGLSARVAGQPQLPGWLAGAVSGLVLAGLVLSGRGQAARDVRHLRSSPLLAAIVAERDDPAAWVAAGRACQRFLLQATMFDLRSAFINQPVEQRPLRSQLDRLLGLRGESVLLLRLGYGRKAAYSLRRPLEDVILSD